MFGGTWKRWGKGKVPVSLDEDDIDFGLIEKFGGEKQHILTESEAPKHSHEFSGAAVTTGTQSAKHTHTGTSGGISADHVHSGASGGISANHYHDIGHGHTFNNPAIAGGTAEGGSHSHKLVGKANWRNDSEFSQDFLLLITQACANWEIEPGHGVYYGGDHSHSISGLYTYNGSVNGIGGVGSGWVSSDHYHWTTTGGVSSNHVHTTTTGDNSANHTHSLVPSGLLGSAGSDKGHNNIQPYITCYMWKRIA